MNAYKKGHFLCRRASDCIGVQVRQKKNVAALMLCAAASTAFGEKLTVDATTLPTLSAVAIDTASGKSVTGTMSGATFVFNVKPARHYDVSLKKPSGDTVRLIDLSWYDDEPPAADAGRLGDHDRANITQVLTGVARFTNNNRVVTLVGDGQRAVALLDLRRDSNFHSRQGGEIIRRVEIWYFKNEAGGWAKVQQQDRVLDRQRYTTADEFEKALSSEVWIPMASGLSIRRGQDSNVKVDSTATTRPAN